jgi:hypothetical protein
MSVNKKVWGSWGSQAFAFSSGEGGHPRCREKDFWIFLMRGANAAPLPPQAPKRGPPGGPRFGFPPSLDSPRDPRRDSVSPGPHSGFGEPLRLFRAGLCSPRLRRLGVGPRGPVCFWVGFAWGGRPERFAPGFGLRGASVLAQGFFWLWSVWPVWVLSVMDTLCLAIRVK